MDLQHLREANQLSVLRETDYQVLREEVDEAALQREAGKHYRHMRLLLHDLIRHNGLPSNSVNTHFSLRLWESAMVQDSLQGNSSQLLTDSFLVQLSFRYPLAVDAWKVHP